jgi:hypothetical protein
MTKQIIDIGSGELTGDGESIRSAFDKTNQNFAEVYTNVGNLTTSTPKIAVTDVGPTGPAVKAGDLWYDEVSGRMFIRYDDTWADASPAVQAPQGPTGPAGPSGGDNPSLVRFYVNPYMINQSYSESGSVEKPYKTIAAALARVNSLINSSTIQPNLTSPVFIVLQGSITESITLTRGHVFLVGDGSSIHAPIYLTGTVTVDASTYEQGFDDNHFSIQGITVVAPLNSFGIHFTGDVEQQLYLQDVGLYASGTGGTGLLMDNTSSNTVNLVHGNNIKITHIGSGDVYCIDVVHGRGDFWEVDTSTTGAEQVAAVGSGASLTFYYSLLEASGTVCVEAYGTGSLSLFNCLVQNFNSSDSYGIWLHNSDSTALISNCYFNVQGGTANSRAVHGPSGSTLYYSGTSFAPNSNRKIDSALNLQPLLTSFSAV